MALVATLLLAFPLGFFIRPRLAAYVAYVAIHSFLFTFQTATLTRAWVGGSTEAFPKDPDAGGWPYGLVNLAIYALGLGLVTAGGTLAARRRSRAGDAVDFG